MSTTITIMDFPQWAKLNQSLEDELEDCMTCDGEGTHECNCGDEHDCGACFGSGKKNGDNLRVLYERQKKADQEKLASWLAINGA